MGMLTAVGADYWWHSVFVAVLIEVSNIHLAWELDAMQLHTCSKLSRLVCYLKCLWTFQASLHFQAMHDCTYNRMLEITHILLKEISGSYEFKCVTTCTGKLVGDRLNHNYGHFCSHQAGPWSTAGMTPFVKEPTQGVWIWNLARMKIYQKH